MIAVDTNVLVYCHRSDSPWHAEAFSALKQLAEGRSPWAIPWPCLHEFLAVATHPKIYAPPSRPEQAMEQLEVWLESPTVVVLSETENYHSVLKSLMCSSRVAGPQIHDARVAALCLAHGVRELWTADRDFSRFPGLSVRNPLIGV